MSPPEPLEPNEMRITFMGSVFPQPRRAQQEMSVFVEVGWVSDPTDTFYQGRAVDQFIFDCGSGVSANYSACNVGFRRMDKIFINHLHADHMGDLAHIYSFGPAGDRKSPLYVWGPGPSGVPNPSYAPPRMKNPGKSQRYYDDGTKAFCKNLREAMRWHTESMSFQGTSYASYTPPTRKSWGLPCDPVPVGDDLPNDSYAMVPIELDWTKSGKVEGDNIAYYNPATGVKITHFPVIHCRKGSVGYKLEWNGLSMIYTSDTKPERNCIEQASNGGLGVDALIHEMIVPPEVYAMKSLGLSAPLPAGVSADFDAYVQGTKDVYASSHTPQGAFGYLLTQIEPRPRLAVATHFPVSDDTVACALQSVQAQCPWVVWDPENPNSGNITWSFDLMVLRLFAGEQRILQQKATVSDYTFAPPVRTPADPLPPKYHDAEGKWDPTAQLDRSTEIPPVEKDGTVNYCEDGY